MEIKDNFNIFNLFLDKNIKIYIDKNIIRVRVPSIKDMQLNDVLNSTYHMWTLPSDKMDKLLSIPLSGSFELITRIIFQLGMYKEYSEVTKNFQQALEFFIPDISFNFKSKQLIVDDITITEEIWEYILYVLRLSCGEKVEKPRTFTSEDERQFYLAQKKMDEKIKKIKAQKPGDSEGLLKSFLTIQYKFNLSFDYLAEQTLAQIQWLQGYAAGAVSYEVNAQAFAAGNMKKGKKLDFFIK